MKSDTRKRPAWIALLPGGRRTRLRLARGVRLCVGDVLRIGRAFYRVERRTTVATAGAWEFVVEVSRPTASSEATTA